MRFGCTGMAEGAEAGTAKLLLFVATECSHFFRNIAAAVSKYQETGALPDSLPAGAPLADPPKEEEGRAAQEGCGEG